MSAAAAAASAPPPIANPTSARFRAGASFTPSPVIPTTILSRCASRTRRLLSDGIALATTHSRGSIFITSLSVICASSVELITFLPLVKSPASSAIAAAVSARSPVIITTCIPARVTSAIAARASERTSSRIAAMDIRVIPFGISSRYRPSYTAMAISRIVRSAASDILAFKLELIFCFSPLASKQWVHFSSIFSGAPFMRVT